MQRLEARLEALGFSSGGMASPADEAMEAPEAGDLSAMEAKETLQRPLRGRRAWRTLRCRTRIGTKKRWRRRRAPPTAWWTRSRSSVDFFDFFESSFCKEDRAKKASERGFWPEFSSEATEELSRE